MTCTDSVSHRNVCYFTLMSRITKTFLVIPSSITPLSIIYDVLNLFLVLLFEPGLTLLLMHLISVWASKYPINEPRLTS